MQETIPSEEPLARYILYGRYIRYDGTVKPEAFIPHPYQELSVTRHYGLTGPDLLHIGKTIAKETGKNLHGRADIITQIIISLNLTLKLAPLPDNPNHVNISNWPQEKSLQKSIAQEIAASNPDVVRY
jgi:hypothetical protein